MATFALPVWTHLIDLWVLGNNYNAGPADLVNVPCQIYVNPRNQGQVITPMIRMQKDLLYASVYHWFDGSTGMVRNPASAYGMYYILYGICPCHAGFPNEYVTCEATQIGYDGVTQVTGFLWNPD